MHKYKTEAIVLKTYDFNEYDKIVVLYSREYGLIRAIAKGAKSSKSKLGATIGPLISFELQMYKGKNLDIVNQCDIVNCFKLIRKDLKKITYGMYYAELVMAFGVENDCNSHGFYQFLYESLNNLSHETDNNALESLLVQFEFSLMTIVGYKPMFDICYSCNNAIGLGSSIFMELDSASFICENCLKPGYKVLDIDSKLHSYLFSLTEEKYNATHTCYNTFVKAHNVMYDYVKNKTTYKIKSQGLIESLCLT